MDLFGLNTTLFSTLFLHLNSDHSTGLHTANNESKSITTVLGNETYPAEFNGTAYLQNYISWNNSYDLDNIPINESHIFKHIITTERTSSHQRLNENQNEKKSVITEKTKTYVKPGWTDIDITSGNVFRPQGALGKNYRNIIPNNGKTLPCLPHCANISQFTSNSKHKHSFRNRYFNYKLLYNSMKREKEMNRQTTEFYAWIFGATMLTLGSLTTLTSCFAFCFCSEKWKKRKRKKKQRDKTGKYLRVDSVSSMVESQTDHRDLYEQLEGVTII